MKNSLRTRHLKLCCVKYTRQIEDKKQKEQEFYLTKKINKNMPVSHTKTYCFTMNFPCFNDD